MLVRRSSPERTMDPFGVNKRVYLQWASSLNPSWGMPGFEFKNDELAVRDALQNLTTSYGSSSAASAASGEYSKSIPIWVA